MVDATLDTEDEETASANDWLASEVARCGSAARNFWSMTVETAASMVDSEG